MNNVGVLVVSVFSGIVILAMVSVVLSKRADTSNVIGATGKALSSIIGAAVSPVTGSSSNQFGASNFGG